MQNTDSSPILNQKETSNNSLIQLDKNGIQTDLNTSASPKNNTKMNIATFMPSVTGTLNQTV